MAPIETNMTTTNISIALEELLSEKFNPSSLTKIQLRSILGEYGGLKYEDLPSSAAKKDVYLDYFKRYIQGRRKEILENLKKVKAEGKGIVVVNEDGSMKTTTGTPIHNLRKSPGAENTKKKVEFNLKSGYFSDENPFQSPVTKKTPRKSEDSESEAKEGIISKKKSVKGRLSTPAVKKRKESLNLMTPEAYRSEDDVSSQTFVKEPGMSPKMLQAIKNPIYQMAFSKRASTSSSGSKTLYFLLVLVLSVVLSTLVGYYHFFKMVKICPSEKIPKSHIIQGSSSMLDIPWLYLSQYLKGKRDLDIYWACPLYGKCVYNSKSQSMGIVCDSGYNFIPPGFFQPPRCEYDMHQHTIVQALTYQMNEYISKRCGFAILQYWKEGILLPDKVAPVLNLNEVENVWKLAAVSDELLFNLFSDESLTGNTEWCKEGPEPFRRYFQRALEILTSSHYSDSIHYQKFANRGQDKTTVVLISKRPSYDFFERIKFVLWMIVWKYWWYMTLFLLTMYYILRFIHQRKRLANIRILSRIIADRAIEKLVEQDYRSREDFTLGTTIPVNQLREYLLKGINYSEPECKILWKEVVLLIEKNSNVRDSMTSVKGEQQRVWEWIGVDALSPTSINKK